MKKSVYAVAAAASVLFASASAVTTRPVLDLDAAAGMRDACIAFAEEKGLALAIAVYDHSGRLVTFARMDGASIAVAEIAQWKGVSASTYLVPTAQTAQWNAPTAPNIATFGGGVPVFTEDGVGLGGIGVSGASSEDDIKCAEAGISAVGLRASRP